MFLDSDSSVSVQHLCYDFLLSILLTTKLSSPNTVNTYFFSILSGTFSKSGLNFSNWNASQYSEDFTWSFDYISSTFHSNEDSNCNLKIIIHSLIHNFLRKEPWCFSMSMAPETTLLSLMSLELLQVDCLRV